LPDLVQYRAREQAVDLAGDRLLTRAVLYRCPKLPGGNQLYD